MAATVSSRWASHVLPHGPLRQLLPEVWEVTGSLKGNPVPRNMLVFRLSDKSLWIHSPVALDEPTLAELLRLGTPSVIVVPNSIHRLDAGVYKERFPSVRVVCPAVARRKVEERVRVDATAEELLPSLGIRCEKPSGTKDFELAYFLKTSQGQVLVVADCLMNLPRLPGVKGWILHLIGSTGFFGMTAMGKFLLLKEPNAFADWLTKLASLPDLLFVCMAHGQAISPPCSVPLLQARSRFRR